MRIYAVIGIVFGLALLYGIHRFVAFRKMRFGGILALLAVCCGVGTVAVFVLRRFLYYAAGYAVAGLFAALLVWVALRRKRKKSEGKG